ncbi:MAG: hypothetical protein COW42_06735, partial [Deltaproteobacteria bacterium CG17_big_fil_post_rev_8_21_14_2_50_63_7]
KGLAMTQVSNSSQDDILALAKRCRDLKRRLVEHTHARYGAHILEAIEGAVSETAAIVLSSMSTHRLKSGACSLIIQRSPSARVGRASGSLSTGMGRFSG